MQNEPRARASTRPLLTQAGERGQRGPHHPTRPERLTDGRGRVVVCGGARRGLSPGTAVSNRSTPDVLGTVARARGGVGPTSGITVKKLDIY